MLSREDVVAAYAFLLGREPEDEAAIAHHRAHPSPGALRRALIASEEFAGLYAQIAGEGPSLAPALAPLPPEGPIETRAEGADRAAMWARVAASWRRLGEEEPHWSVLTLEDYRPDVIAENRESFLATAEIDVALVDSALARLPGADALRAGLCLEIGCGVGRATRGLAGRFARVLGVDVSAPHLAVAREELDAAGVGNVALRRMETVDDYALADAPAFLYSRIVLQHNPPPVQAAILEAALGALAAPGAALFQVVTHIRDYRFSVAEYLAGEREGMEMHALPQARVFEVLRASGMELLEVARDDAATGDDPRFRSHLVLARKPAPAA